MTREQFELIYKDSTLTGDQWEQLWLKMRMGRFGASEVHRLMSTSKSTGLETYVHEKVSEIVTGDREGTYTNQYMEDGNTQEINAAKEYMKRNNCVLTLKTYCKIGDHVGCSSDGIDINRKRVIEIKCPMFKTHLKYLAINSNKDLLSVSKKYYAQCQMNIWALDFKVCDFITYYPPEYLDFPVTHYKQVEIKRDNNFIKELLKGLDKAIDYKIDLLKKIGYTKTKAISQG